MADHVATAEIQIDARLGRVWDALVDPKLIKKYMFGTEVVTDWQRGSPIVWKGVYEGKSYEDKGGILAIEPERLLRVTHFSPLSGKEDVPANYHTLTYELEKNGDKTRVALSQDNNASEEEAEHSRSNWEKLLSGLKEVVESS
ncbi:MAG TPA: SRPBCC domain-containing protein [Acidimicrobiia bacterium]|nr:SRPBCC domain-containing protein [Acidimicrobiia bacterium]